MDKPQERELPYAWVILALTFLAVAIAIGVRSTLGLLIRPWENDFGWDRAAISLVASIGFLSNGLARAAAGRWSDLVGPRIVFAGSFVLLAVGTAAMGFVQSLWQVYFVFGIIVMAATGGASNVTAAVAIARWFYRKKALAVGIMASGAAAGQLVLVPAAAVLMKNSGWRAGYIWLGFGILIFVVPVFLIFFRDDPPVSAGAAGAGRAKDKSPQPLARLARQMNFWWLVGSFWICGITTSGLIETHLIPFAEDIQIDSVTAAAAFGVLGAFNVMGTLISGAISDRVGHTRLLGWIYAGRGVSLIFLIFVRDPVTLFIFAMSFGIVDFATVPPTTTLATTLFGRRSGGTVFGLVFLSHQIGSAMGAYFGGLVHDIWGNYTPIFMVAALICFAAAGMSWAIRETPMPTPEPAAA